MGLVVVNYAATMAVHTCALTEVIIFSISYDIKLTE